MALLVLIDVSWVQIVAAKILGCRLGLLMIHHSDSKLVIRRVLRMACFGNDAVEADLDGFVAIEIV